MEKIKLYEKAILEIIQQQNLVRLADPNSYVVTDTQRNHYQILIENWSEKEKHSLKVFMHFHIKPDGKIHILENYSSTDVGEELTERGVAKNDIVLAFLPQYTRAYSGYGVE